jgi:hypothetical protein
VVAPGPCFPNFTVTDGEDAEGIGGILGLKIGF